MRKYYATEVYSKKHSQKTVLKNDHLKGKEEVFQTHDSNCCCVLCKTTNSLQCQINTEEKERSDGKQTADKPDHVVFFSLIAKQNTHNL